MANYHSIPLEFHRLPQPDLHMNPHFTYEKEAPEENHSHPDPHDAPDALLLPRVPSASLYMDELMAQWPLSTSPQPQYITSFPGAGTERSSVATSFDFSEWNSEQSPGRSQSLLPPAPQLVRRPSSDTVKVECRLSSPSSPSKVRTGTGRTLNPDQLRDLSEQFQKFSFSNDNASSPSTRSITPVPSLTSSNYSRSSLGLGEISPCASRRSPREPLLSSQPGTKMTTVNKKPLKVSTNGSRILKISSPLPSPTFCQTAHPDWSTLPVDPSRNSSFVPFRPVPIPGLNIPSVQQPQSSADAQEVSYIDWDDEKVADSPLERIKRSISDLRAAERHIAEANSRNRMEAARAVKETPDSATRHGSSDASSHSHDLDQVSPERGTHGASPAKLRKKASMKNVSTSARSSNTDSPTTPPSTSKRKRSTVVNSRRSSVMHKKKAKNNSVKKLVKKLLGARKEQ